MSVAATIVATLVVLFPGRAPSSVVALDEARPPAADELTLGYLRARLRADPGDGAVRLQLARALHVLARFDDAEATLAPLLALAPAPRAPPDARPAATPMTQIATATATPTESANPTPTEIATATATQSESANPTPTEIATATATHSESANPTRTETASATATPTESGSPLAQARPPLALVVAARRLGLELALARRDALPESDRRRPPLLVAAVAALERLRELPLSAAELDRLGVVALGLGRPSVAAEIQLQLAAAARPVDAAARLVEAGRLALAAGEALRAADAFEAAAAVDPDPARAVDHALRAIDALVGADAGERAFDLVATLLARQPAPGRLIERGVALALARGHLDAAVAWSGVALARAPDDPHLLRRQVELALASRDLRAALELQARLVAVAPDAAAHERLAVIASWAGRPERALPSRLWLAHRHARPGAVADALALARALREDAPVIELLRREARRAAPTRDAALALVDVYVHQGDASAAVAELRRWLAAHPGDAAARERLAVLLEDEGDLAAALDQRDILASLDSGDAGASGGVAFGGGRDRGGGVGERARGGGGVGGRDRGGGGVVVGGRDRGGGVGERDRGGSVGGRDRGGVVVGSDRGVAVGGRDRGGGVDGRDRGGGGVGGRERGGVAVGGRDRGSGGGGGGVVDGGGDVARREAGRAGAGPSVLGAQAHARGAAAGGAGVAVAAATRRAELAYRLHDPRRALAVLRAVRPLATPDDTRYWRRLADVARAAAAPADALDAELALWRAGALDPPAVSGLLALAHELHRVDLLLDVGPAAYARTGEPRHLLAAIEGALGARRFADGARLFALARRDRGRFEPLAAFWLASSELASHERRFADAAADARAALDREPGSTAARLALMWAAVDGSDVATVRETVAAFRADAAREPAFTAAFATALERLDRPGEALPFHRRQAVEHPDDPHAVLDYADALERAGRVVAAHRLRLHVRERLRPLALATAARIAAAPPTDRRLAPDDAETLVAYAHLLVATDGPVAARAFLRPMVARAGDDGALRELDATVSLDLDRPDLARARVSADGPAWQRLAVALAAEDRAAVAAAAALPDRDVPASQRVEADVALGRPAAAFARALDGLRDAPSPGEVDALRDAAAALEADLGRRVGVEAAIDVLGPLTVERTGARATVGAVAGATLEVAAAYTHLASDDTPRLHVYSIQHEADFALRGVLPGRRGDTRFSLGVAARADAAMPHAALTRTFRPRPGMELGLDLALQDLADETPVARAVGGRSRAGAFATVDLSPREFVAAAVGARAWLTRAFAPLAGGVEAELEVGHRLSLGHPIADLHLVGTLLYAWLAPRTPSGILDLTGEPMANIVPPLHASAGVGLVLGDGVPVSSVGAGALRGDSPRTGRLTYLLDAFFGWQYASVLSTGDAAHRLAYHVRAGVGLPLLGGVAAASGYYGNDAGVASLNAYRGLELSYTHHFSR